MPSMKRFCTICYHEFESVPPAVACPECGAKPASILELGGAHIGDASEPSITLPQTVEEVRDIARKKLKGICAVYPQCDGMGERICQRETYGKAIGFGGAGSGASFKANVSSLAKLRLKTRVIGQHFAVDTAFAFCGINLSMPIMGASTSGVGRYTESGSEIDFCRATIRGCREAGTITWRGDTWFYTLDESPALDALEKEGGFGIPIFKPRSQDILKKTH